MKYIINQYNGAEITSVENVTLDCFSYEVKSIISRCQKSNVYLIWLEIHENRSELINVAVNLGFKFHHCNGEFLKLVKKLEGDVYVPNAAMHYVGAGGVVFSDDNEVLLVSELRGHRKGFYKLPGGNLEISENIRHAVVREIYEETNIKSRFIGLSSIAHLHGWYENKSNLYFICVLRAETYDIIIEEDEILECIWLPVNDLKSHKKITEFNKQAIKNALNSIPLKSMDVNSYLKDLNEDGFKAESHDFEYYK
ncbi:MAG: NUDIX domain-containing protein [Methylococcales bacterium]